MKLRKEFTCPLEIVHDILKGKWKMVILYQLKHMGNSSLADLEELLCNNNVDEILVCGMMTQNCVTHTAISKDAEKYKVKVITDCCTSVSEPIHFIALHALSTRVELIAKEQI